MERIGRGLKALMQNRRSGVSMIVAVCAGVLLLGLTSSLLYAASLPLARANRKIGRERCSQLSASFAQVLDGELRRYVTEDASIPLDPSRDELCAAPGSGLFYNYTNQVLEDDKYGEYDPTDPDSGLYYQTMSGGGGEYGEITVRLRKTDLKENFENSVNQKNPPYDSFGFFHYEDRSTGTETAERVEFIRYQFTVDVTVRLDGDSSHTSTEYYRKDSFQPVYLWNTSNLGSKPAWAAVNTDPVQVYWDGTDFYKDSNFATKMEFRHAEKWEWVLNPETGLEELVCTETWTETVDISYTYNTEHTTYKRYIPVYVERGRGERR